MNRPPAAPKSFAVRLMRLMGDAGWRVALNVLPYALAAGALTEAVLRLRLLPWWKLPLVLATLACLVLAALLGAHVAALREAGGPAGLPSSRAHLRAAARLSAEGLTLLAVVLLAALALVGALDLAVAAAAPLPGSPWPALALRGTATLAVIAVIAVLLAGATAMAASSVREFMSVADAAHALARRSERTMAVIAAVIVSGTLAVIAAAGLIRLAELSPVIGAALAQMAGYLLALTVLAVGAAALAAGD